MRIAIILAYFRLPFAPSQPEHFMSTLAAAKIQPITMCNAQKLGITQPEAQLLLCCTSRTIDGETAQTIENLLQTDLDWPYLLKIATQNNVLPALLLNLRPYADLIPPQILHQLQKTCWLKTARNMVLTKALVKLLALFAEHNIRAIPFKGPVLAMAIYEDIAQRHFCDIDILVSPQDFPRARKLLLSQGYQTSSDFGWAESLLHPLTKVNVDLHQGLPFLSLDFEGLWQRLIPISLNNSTVMALSSEDRILILCFKIAIDSSSIRHFRLSLLNDLSELLQKQPNLDWNLLLKRAKRQHGERKFLLGLFLVNELFPIPVPKQVWNRLKPFRPILKSTVPQLYQQCFQDIDPDKLPLSFRGLNHLFAIAGQETIFDLVNYYFGFLIRLSPNDTAMVTLPSSLSFIYYPLRLLRLLKNLLMFLIWKLKMSP